MIYLYHIRKCGGRSLIFSILGSYGDAGEMWAAACRVGRVEYGGHVFCGCAAPAPDTHFAWSHAEYDSVTIPATAFTVTILRDPLARIISYYAMLRMYEAAAVGHNSIPADEMAALGGNLLEFVNAIPRWRLLRQLSMFSSTLNIDEAVNRIMALSHYFRVENYAVGLTRLSDKLGVELREYKISDPGQSEQVKQRVAAELGTCRDELRAMLEPEYKLMEALGYG